MQVARRYRLALALVCFGCASGITWGAAQSGSLDRGFSRDGIQTVRIPGGGGFPEDVAVQADGRIVVVGGGGYGQFAVARLTATGSLDESFAKDGIWTRSFRREALDDGGASSVVVQPAGKIVVAGYMSTTDPQDFEQTSHLIVLRLLPSGELDPSFADNGLLDLEIETVAAFNERVGLALQSDGRLVAGLTQGAGPRRLEVLVARINPDGSLDPSFAGDGRAEVGFGSTFSDLAALALDADGRIVVAGTASRGRRSSLGLLRLTGAGELDPAFSGDGRITTRVGSPYTIGSDLAITDEGGAFVVGAANHPRRDPDRMTSEFALARFTADGRLDPGFSRDGKRTLKVSPYSAATAVASGPDGRFVVTGGAGTRGSFRTDAIPVLRFTPGGGLDRTFGRRGIVRTEVGRPGSLGPVGRGIATQPDGKIVVVGNTQYVRRGVAFAVLRYRAD